MLYLLQVCIADLSRTVSLATPGSRIAALRLTVLATLSGATVEGCNNVRAYPVPTPIEHIYRAISRVMHAKRRSSYHRGYAIVPLRAPDLAILRR